jgi:hypothetical protein
MLRNRRLNFVRALQVGAASWNAVGFRWVWLLARHRTRQTYTAHIVLHAEFTIID